MTGFRKPPIVVAPTGLAGRFEIGIKILDKDFSRFSNNIGCFSLQDTFSFFISFKIHRDLVSQSVTSRQASSTLPGSLLEIQTLGPTPDPR